MPFYVVRVSGQLGQKRVSVAPDEFETADLAEAVALTRWPEDPYFVVEADDRDSAAARAIAESRALDDLGS